MSLPQNGKRRRPRKQQPTPFDQRDFPKEISRCLEQVGAVAGVSRRQIFEDFVALSEATLAALPGQVKAAGVAGRLAPDPPESADLFARIRARYAHGWLGPDRQTRVWHHFAEAFALLLEATEPGLWGEPNSLAIAGPLSGPDILGHLYQTWVTPHRGSAEIYTPWPVCKLMAGIILGQHSEQQVYARLKEALCHPDNILGAATLLAGLVLPDNEPAAVQEYFLTRLLPATAGFYKPVSICDPALGSGRTLLAAAIQLPAWMVRYGLVKFVGQDISLLATRMAKATSRLYGLNGYALQLQAAAAEALAAQQQQVGSPVSLLRAVYQNGAAPPDNPSGPSFARMFRSAVVGAAGG